MTKTMFLLMLIEAFPNHYSLTLNQVDDLKSPFFASQASRKGLGTLGSSKAPLGTLGGEALAGLLA